MTGPFFENMADHILCHIPPDIACDREQTYCGFRFPTAVNETDGIFRALNRTTGFLQPSKSVGSLRSSWTVSEPTPAVFRSTHLFGTQPKRIREVHRIPTGKPVQIQPSGQPNRVFLRKLIPFAISL